MNWHLIHRNLPKENENIYFSNAHMQISIEVLFIILLNLEKPKCPSLRKDKLWYIHIKNYTQQFKKK